MAEATTSRNESNYIKIAMVLFRVSPRALRAQFDKEFDPDCLQKTLKSKWVRLDDLKKKKCITQPQWNLLFPRTGEPSSTDFDITLMICLLRNLIPIDIMDRLPSATDTSLRADLSRIKFYRNLIVHCDSALVDDTDFESYWKDATAAIIRLGGNSLKAECDDWYGRNLNAEQREYLDCIKIKKQQAFMEEELQEQNKELAESNKKIAKILQEQNNPVPKKIRESFTVEIESWKKDPFIETSAVATILEEVRNKAFVVITGPYGVGKSTIVKSVALQLQRTNDILPVMCPKDIVKYFDPDIKQIYFFDDIYGKCSVDQSMIYSWERVNCQILKYCNDNKDFRILGTCRSEISNSHEFRKLQKIFDITECNLLQKKFLYSKEEKLKIAACHIDQETIKQLDNKILNAYNMFPLLCMMYAASESNPGVRFFEYPLQAVEEQLDKMQELNECCFIGLGLIVIYNNKLYKHLLQNRHDQKFEDVYNDVFEDLGLVNRPSKRSVLSGLQAQEGIYAKELESTITVIHDKIFDILSLYFGKRIPKTILTHGCGAFIAERFLFESIEEDCDDLKIVLSSELEHSYFNCMVEEIENNRFYNVFENVQVHNELYQRKFISFLSKHANQSIIQKLLYDKWPLYLSAANGCKLLVQFILNEKRTSGMCNKLDKDGNHQDNLMDKPESDMYACSYDSDSESESRSLCELVYLWKYYHTDNDESIMKEDAYRILFENSPMVAACEKGYIDIVECLVKNGYNIDHSDGDLPTPLFSACQYGNKDVVDFLLKSNCKVDAMNKHGQIALHAACKNGNIDIVTSLLKCNSSVNLCDIGGYFSPLFIACIKGHTDVVQILLDNNFDTRQAIDGACNAGYKNIVEIFIKHNVDINDTMSIIDYCTLIPSTCFNGHTDIVKLLLDNNCDFLDDNGFSRALNFACEGDFVDVVDLLLRNNCNINQCRPETNQSPLIIACDGDKEAVVKLLLSYEACDVNIIDCDNRNALHYACREGQSDIVELLLKRHCSVNLNDKKMKTPLFIACQEGHVDIVKMLINQDNCMIDVLDVKGNGLLHATYGIFYPSFHYKTPDINGRIGIIGLLLDKGCDVNVLNNKGQSVLHVACKYGDTAIVDILLRRNSNVNQCDKANKTPLFIACVNGYIDIVRLLIESKCEISNHSPYGQTVLHTVCHGGVSRSRRSYLGFEPFTEGYKDILTLLNDKKCDVNISDNNSKTPLHIACYKGNVALVEILLRNKCVVDQCDNLNKTPFFLACEKGHKDVVKSLMNNNCNMDIRDKIGRSALHAVCRTHSMYYMFDYEGDRVDIAKLLINKRCGVYDLDDTGQSALHVACEYGHTKIVDMLLRSNSNVNQCDKAKKTPLFIACEYGDIDIVRLLIDKKCDVNISGNNSQTPLHIACYKGNVALVEILLRNKCVVDQCDYLNKTPFFIACEEGHKDVVKFLMNNNCNMHITDKIGRSALHAVCAFCTPHYDNRFIGHRVSIAQHLINIKCGVYDLDEGDRSRDIAELLINKKCGFYVLDEAGQSALHGACKQGNPGIVQLLLENKFDVDQRDKMGETPIFNACRRYHSDVLKLLIEWNCDVNILNINGLNALNIVFNSEWFSQLFNFSRFIPVKKDVKLLDSDCSVNICDAEGRTPLHMACSGGYVDIAELLLKRNSNINQCDKLKKTPLILAVEGGNTKIVKLLVDSDCSVNNCDADGRTPLHRACSKGYVDEAELFLKRNRNINQCDKLMKTPRIVVVESEHSQVVKLLVDSGCSVNICDADGQTPLHMACREGCVGEAELFLKRNSNINQRDKLMKTPLILAVEGRHTKVVEMLVENKCDVDIKDKDGRTALDIAVKKRVVDIKNILLNVMEKKYQ